MAIKLLSVNGVDNSKVAEYIVDLESEKDNVPIDDKIFGTRCFVCESGKRYRLDSGLNWVEEGEDNDGGGTAPSVIIQSLTVTQNGTSTAPQGRAYSPVIVNVANSYAAGDEGKVVSGGALIAQTAHATVTEDGTIDTTYNNSVEIAVASSLDPVAEEKDVNFIDYDGTIRYSYTAQEFANLSELPANPAHNGLTAQGWNWSLSDAKTYAAAYKKLWIGQNYITNSGDTEIDIELYTGRLSPYFNIAILGTVTIDWGDETTPSTITGSSLTTRISTLHNYTNPGKYTISIHVNSGEFSFYGVKGLGQAPLLTKSSDSDNNDLSYCTTVSNIRIGNNVRIGNSAFFNCINLKTITLPNTIGSVSSCGFDSCKQLVSITIPNQCIVIGSAAFEYCERLQNISISNGVEVIDEYAFNYCSGLSTVTLPNNEDFYEIEGYTFRGCYVLKTAIIPEGITKIKAHAFWADYALSNITIPSTVTTIGSAAFAVTNLGEVHFKPHDPPTLESDDVFNFVPTDCIIYVPTGTLSDYTTATNYPSAGSYGYVEE